MKGGSIDQMMSGGCELSFSCKCGNTVCWFTEDVPVRGSVNFYKKKYISAHRSP